MEEIINHADEDGSLPSVQDLQNNNSIIIENNTDTKTNSQPSGVEKIIIHDVQILQNVSTSRRCSSEYDIENMDIIMIKQTSPYEYISKSNVEDAMFCIIEEKPFQILDEVSLLVDAEFSARKESVKQLEKIDHIFESQENKQEEEKKLSKKRKRLPDQWKRNIRKQKRQAGGEYINTKGQLARSKEVQQKTCLSKKCVFACEKKITQVERLNFHKAYWGLTDEQKPHFLSKHITRQFAKRKRTDKEDSRKKYFYEYFFEVYGVRVRVCQAFFLNTLDISKQKIYYFFKNIQREETNVPRCLLSKKHSKKVVSDESVAKVKKHIKSFPVVDSLYCRANSKKIFRERSKF